VKTLTTLVAAVAALAVAAPVQAAKVEVPHVIGRQLLSGEAALQLYGFRWNNLPQVKDPTKWVICTQRPRAGLVLPIGTFVHITVARPGRC
jgi:beta-lactam-binding protein with PASTA domain